MEEEIENSDKGALTKATLSELLIDQVNLNRKDAKDVVDAFFEVICRHLINAEDVKISGFGNFHVREKSTRPGRNPRTGESIDIKARSVVTFHASQKFKDQLE